MTRQPKPGVGPVYIDRRRRATMPYCFNVVRLNECGAIEVEVHRHPTEERAEEARTAMIENLRPPRPAAPSAQPDRNELLVAAAEFGPHSIGQPRGSVLPDPDLCPDCGRPGDWHKGTLICVNYRCAIYGATIRVPSPGEAVPA